MSICVAKLVTTWCGVNIVVALHSGGPPSAPNFEAVPLFDWSACGGSADVFLLKCSFMPWLQGDG